MISCMIDVMEVHDVETAYIPWYFLHNDEEGGDIHIKMEGTMVNWLEEIGPAYYKDVIYLDSSVRKFMYAEANKSIYGTL